MIFCLHICHTGCLTALSSHTAGGIHSSAITIPLKSCLPIALNVLEFLWRSCPPPTAKNRISTVFVMVYWKSQILLQRLLINVFPGYSCIFLSWHYISVERHYTSTGFQFDLLSHSTPWLCTCVKHVCIVKMFSSLHQCSALYRSNSTCKLQKTSVQNFIPRLCAFFSRHNGSLGELFMVVSPFAGHVSPE